jgi:hypothetical protein
MKLKWEGTFFFFFYCSLDIFLEIFSLKFFIFHFLFLFIEDLAFQSNTSFVLCLSPWIFLGVSHRKIVKERESDWLVKS